MKLNRAQQVLIEARKLLDRPYGWTTGSFRRRRRLPGGGHITAYCSIGAFWAAAHMLRIQKNTGCSARSALERVIGGSISPWNDAPGRKKHEVLAAFDDAIEKADA